MGKDSVPACTGPAGGPRTAMEGELLKWTNYFSGWQPRWFLLCGGILSYYNSREEAWKGCKGSIQMAVCEIQVHSSDSTRMDLTIPGQQRFYLRARSPAERQKWLVALGSAKACLADIQTKKEMEFSDRIEALKAKMAELRLRCDLLIQQLNKTKVLSAEPGGLEADSQEVLDAAVLLRSTSNAFLKTLEECMQMSQATFSSEALQAPPPEFHPPVFLNPNTVRPPGVASRIKMERQTELNNNCEKGPVSPDRICREATVIPNDRPCSPRGGDLPAQSTVLENMAGADASDAICRLCATDCDGACSSVQPKAEPASEANALSHPEERQDDDSGGGWEEVQTFFSIMSHRFNEIVLLQDDGIPTQLFLDCCYAIVPVLDKLGPTVFAPVKMDFVGNIKKINQKFITQKEEFHTLQSIVLHEVHNNLAGVRNSATEALLWLKRGLKFLKEFLTELKNGEKNINTALSSAYGKTLRQYHGWVVRGVFALALRAAPTYDSFAAALAVGERDDWKEAFGHALRRDLSVYLPAIEKQLDLLDALYEEHNLESDEVV